MVDLRVCRAPHKHPLSSFLLAVLIVALTTPPPVARQVQMPHSTGLYPLLPPKPVEEGFRHESRGAAHTSLTSRICLLLEFQPLAEVVVARNLVKVVLAPPVVEVELILIGAVVHDADPAPVLHRLAIQKLPVQSLVLAALLRERAAHSVGGLVRGFAALSRGLHDGEIHNRAETKQPHLLVVQAAKTQRQLLRRHALARNRVSVDVDGADFPLCALLTDHALLPLARVLDGEVALLLDFRCDRRPHLLSRHRLASSFLPELCG
mmetsp:Transcript_9054/g.22154  ORF Transcript_9054/g.22154 Transcript_9054/m.22154 type:complete len:264 (-) Transcript_9054:624-1415(-)